MDDRGQKMMRMSFEFLTKLLKDHPATQSSLPVDARLECIYQEPPEIRGWNRTLCCVFSSAEWDLVPEGHTIPWCEVTFRTGA